MVRKTHPTCSALGGATPGRSKKAGPLPGPAAVTGRFFSQAYYILQGGVGNQEKSSCRDNLPSGRNRAAALPEEGGPVGAAPRHQSGRGGLTASPLPEKWKPATGPPSPDFRLSAPKTLPDLNKTPLQAILYTKWNSYPLGREFLVLWWKKHCRIDIVNHNINISGDLSGGPPAPRQRLKGIRGYLE